MSFLKICWGIVLAIFAGQALALSLGNLSVQSKIGEPLVAQINLQINPDEFSSVKDIQVALAAPEMYQRLGISSSATQAQLKVSLIKDANQQPIAVKIASDDILKLAPNEIFLDALLEVRWSAGLVRRVYTLMVADQAKVEVKAGETLTGIAERVIAGFDDATLDQALIALYRANPQAFAGGSIHRLMAGAEIQVPSRAMIQSVPKAEAKEIAVSADAAYRSGQANVSLTEVVKTQKSSESAKDRLKVGPAAGLEGEAKRRMEELLVQEKALADAKLRIVELEKNIADLKRLIQNPGAEKSEAVDWKNYSGPLVIGGLVLLAIVVLLKLSKNEAQKSHHQNATAHTDSASSKAQTVGMPDQAAKLFASLDLNLDASKSVSSNQALATDLPSAESLRVKLNLVRAYITIEDFNAARTAIQEVLAVSNQVDPELTIQAKSLMAEVNQRSS